MMLNLLTWLRYSLPGFSTLKSPFFSSFHSVVIESESLSNIYTQRIEITFYHFEEIVSTCIVLEFCMRDLFLHPLFVKCSIIYISIDIWIFILSLSYNPIVRYLFCCSNCSRFGQWEVFQLALCSFDITHHCIFCLFLVCFSTCLLSDTTKYPTFILYIASPTLEPANSPKSLYSFHWRVVLENEISTQGLSIATGVSWLLGPLSG